MLALRSVLDTEVERDYCHYEGGVIVKKVVTVQVKDRLALTREQADAHDRAAEALRKLQVQHEESASSGAQSLKQVR